MKYDWKDAGEEWSEPWGTSAAQWFGAILPRIRDCVQTGTILEIAPGFGRWTHYLKNYCQQLWTVDSVAECTEACRRRFAADSRVRCYLNDGRSLPMFPNPLTMPGLSAARVATTAARKNTGKIRTRVGNWKTICKINSLAISATCRSLLSNCRAVCHRSCELRSRSPSFSPAARSKRSRCRRFCHP